MAPTKPSWVKHIDFMLIDLLVLAGSFALAVYLKFDSLSLFRYERWRSLLVLLMLVHVSCTLLMETYSGVLRRSYWDDVDAYIRLALGCFVITTLAFYLMKLGAVFSRVALVSTYVMYLVVSLLAKAAWKKCLLSRTDALPQDSVQRVVLVTASAARAETEHMLYAEDLRSHEVVGVCLVDGAQECVSDRPIVGLDGLDELVQTLNADQVLVTVSPHLLDADVYEQLIADGVRVSFAIEEALGISSEIQTLGHAGVMRTLDLDRYTFGTGQMLYLPIKRFFDILFGLLGVAATLPVALVVKFAYLADGDTHSIFYTQRRVGIHGTLFGLYKFRSMVRNADEVLKDLLKDPEIRRQWEKDQKLENDPRITKVGNFIRKTSLDEFPQFINVLKGDMSIVGPRPLVPGELEQHGGRALYNRVKPGITGWWGCNGRSNINYRERLELEYHYVRHCSLYLDVVCVLRTFLAVLKRDGAV